MVTKLLSSNGHLSDTSHVVVFRLPGKEIVEIEGGGEIKFEDQD
jgi:hypothetical protein